MSRAAPRDVTALLGEVAAGVRVGTPPGDAWARVGVAVDAHGVPHVRSLHEAGLPPEHAAAVRAAARLAVELGSSPAPVLASTAVSVARDAEAADRRRAALAGPRATARLLGWLPATAPLLGAVVGASPVPVLLDGGAGTGCLCLAALLLATGRLWVAREVGRAAAAGETA